MDSTMGWQDRGYNSGREEMNAFFSNPSSALQWALPIYRSSSLHIRLHFWLLLAVLFRVVDIVRSSTPRYYIPIDIALLLLAVLIHELGHRVFSQRVGGNHWEWVLWPLGGMIPPAS